ncbi:MAG: ABC transporter substrate-binding protein [Solirubrobacteraceae bacterium]
MPLVGREPELATAAAVLAGAEAGTGTVLFVTGEAGIGKSRLLGEMRERFGGRWLEGHCASYGDQLSYWPFRELLRDWLGAGADEPELRVRIALRRELERLFGARAEELGSYLSALLGVGLDPETARRVDELAPEALQYRTFEVMGELVARLAADGPLALALEDLHWADATSLALAGHLLATAESAGVLLVLSQRAEPDHPSWALRERAAREYPHLTREVAVAPLAPAAERALLAALVGGRSLPGALAERLTGEAEGNPFYLEEIVRSLIDCGALIPDGAGWRLDPAAEISVPRSVEKVILARIDRLGDDAQHALRAASVLGRRFALGLLERVAGDDPRDLRAALHELQRADLIRGARRLPEPEFRFKHALIQDAVYRTLVSGERTRMHRRAAEWLEARHAERLDDVAGLLAHHWIAAADIAKAARYLGLAGDRARQEHALDEAVAFYSTLLGLLDEDGATQEVALVLFKLALALHSDLRFAEANAAYQRAFDLWRPEPAAAPATERLVVAAPAVPDDPDPLTALSWTNIHLAMQLFDRLVEAWPERTIVPSLAERWEISDDGLRYRFRLRAGLRWSDGAPLTAHDVEYGIRRILDPARPGASAAIYYVLERGQEYCLGTEPDVRRVGVEALDERTVEFRLAAPAPYFLHVMSRPDGAPQPRHAIEASPDGWLAPGSDVVSGPFRLRERSEERVTLERRDGDAGARAGNVATVELVARAPQAAIADLRAGRADAVAFFYAPQPAADPVADVHWDLGPAASTAYVAFDHDDPLTARADVRLALAHAIDRAALAPVMPVNHIPALGGLVPPALQGHTPEIAPRFAPERAASMLAQAGVAPGTPLRLAAPSSWLGIAECVAAGWRETLGLAAEAFVWSPRGGGAGGRPWVVAPAFVTSWLPGYPDPEYYLRLLLHSASPTNEGGFADAIFDELVERAGAERDGRLRLELFHQADRHAVAGRAALIPLLYGRSAVALAPGIDGWWAFGKSAASFADLTVARPG